MLYPTTELACCSEGISMHQSEIEKKLNLMLLRSVGIEDRIWILLEATEEQGCSKPELAEYARGVITEVSRWIDQCTMDFPSPPILLRRMEIQLARLEKVEELLEKNTISSE